MSLRVEDASVGGLAGSVAVERLARQPRLLPVLLRDRTALAGLVIIAVVILAAAAGPLVVAHDPNAVDVNRSFAGPSRSFPLGTDHLGRDMLSRLLYGARVSVAATLVASFASALIGVAVGMAAGYAGRLVDAVLRSVMDVLLAFPSFLLALAVTGVLGPSLVTVVIAIVVSWWAGYARIARAAVLAERERPYIEAERGLGASPLRILARHLLPNILGPIVVITTLDMGTILLGISGLSFLGLGVRPPTAEWGSMLSEARPYLTDAPRLVLLPGVAILLLVLAFNLLGDGLRDLLDPRTSSR